MNLTFKFLSHFLPSLIYTVKYNIYHINAQKVSCMPYIDLIFLI